MKRLLLLSLFAVCCWFGGFAQLVRVVNEVHYDPNIGPAVLNYPAGHRTYRVYAELQDPTDFVSSIYSVAGCHTLTISAGAGNAIWNSPFGGTLGENLNIAFFGFFPELQYDSFITIGRANSAAPGNAVGIIASCPAPGVWAASLGTVAGPALNVCDGAVYALNGDLNGFPTGPLNRVLLFQITMPAVNTLSYQINLQVFNEGLGANEIRYVWDENNVGCGSPTEVSGQCLGLYWPEPPACSGAPGCTDPDACNYDPAATQDDGSCEYLSCAGCTDAGACNYDPAATIDDGSCTFPGCTDVNACNYDANAGCEDGSCTFPGCTDVNACNYDANAGCDDGSCTFPGCTDVNACNYDAGAGCDDGSCTFPGCTDVNACNFDANAGCDDGSCTFPGCTDVNACNYDANAGCDDGSCTFPGCTDVNACNYEANAGCDDGSCVFPGCTDLGACNYDPAAGCDDGSCEYVSCAGCTDPTACNFDITATIEDGSCTYPGCTDPGALNYDANAGCDDGSCSYNEGCTNPLACNFDPGAIVDDGTCEFVSCAGCTDVNACNYDPTATIEDGSCEYLSCAGCADPGACNFDPTATIEDGSCEYLSCAGCTDPAACNYDITATIEDGSCTYPGCTDAGACNYDINAGCDDGSCTYPGCTNPGACNYDMNAGCDNGSCTFPGCTDAGACNYDANAGCDDGSCTYPGCTDPLACNYDMNAGCDNGSCDYGSCAGCTDPGACNFDPAATQDDGSCEYLSCAGCTDAGACNYDAGATIDDGSCDYSCFGCTDPGACNYDAGATQDDGSCDYSCFGCTDPGADNYDPGATVDDGSCIFGGLPAQALVAQFFPNCVGVLSATSIPGANSGLPTPLGGNADDEVFFAFVAPCNGGIKIDVDGFGIDAAVQLLDGLYSNLDASNSTGFGGTEVCFADGLVGGNTYFVRVYDFGTGNQGGFNICLSAFCASSPDAPYPSLTYDACDVYKCDFIPAASSYNWTFTEQGDGTVLTYSSVGNNTFINLSNLSGPVEYGETYDVVIDAVFNDPDLGQVVIEGQITDVCVMNDAPFTELRSDFVGGNYQLNANIRCVQSCGADAYIWRLTPVGGQSLPTVQVGGASTIVNLCDFAGILPGTTYNVEVAVVYNGIDYGFGPVAQINTAAQPLVFLRAADNCNNAGPLQLGAYIRTNAFVPCAKDWTWEFTRTDVPELPIYWRKGDGVRLLQLSAVKDLQTNTSLLVAGATYNVRVKPEYGNFLGNGNDIPGAEPDYDFATSYGAVDQICIVGGAINGGGNNFVAEDLQPVREAGAALEAALYPNPTNGAFVNLNIGNIAEGTDRVSVDVYDAFGKLVKSEQIAVNGNSFSTVLTFGEGFASGVYMVNITVGTSVTTERLVIQK